MNEFTVTVTFKPTHQLTQEQKDRLRNGIMDGANGAVIGLNNPGFISAAPAPQPADNCLIPDYGATEGP